MRGKGGRGEEKHEGGKSTNVRERCGEKEEEEEKMESRKGGRLEENEKR